jgi:hypothetical protein
MYFYQTYNFKQVQYLSPKSSFIFYFRRRHLPDGKGRQSVQRVQPNSGHFNDGPGRKNGKAYVNAWQGQSGGWGGG